MRERDAARAALENDAERLRVVDHEMPRWIAPALAVAFAAYFAVQDLAGPAVRHTMAFVFAFGYLGLVVGPLLRQRRDEQARLRAELVPPQHRRRVWVAASVLLVVLLGGVLLPDRLDWPYGTLAYGAVLGVPVLAGGWWLRRALARDLRTAP